MVGVEIFMGAFLAGWGIWFFHQSTHFPPSLLSYGHLPFLIQKIASASFLFLGLGLMARALILSDEHKRFILKRPLNLMNIAFLILFFFLWLPKAGPYALMALIFPCLALFSLQERWQKVTNSTLVLALVVLAVYGLVTQISFPR